MLSRLQKCHLGPCALSLMGSTSQPPLSEETLRAVAPSIKQTRTHLVSQEGSCRMKKLTMREEGKAWDMAGRIGQLTFWRQWPRWKEALSSWTQPGLREKGVSF